MPLAILFWVIMIIWLFYGFWVHNDPAAPWYRWGLPHLMTWIVLAILGWGVFGPVINNSGATPTYQRR